MKYLNNCFFALLVCVFLFLQGCSGLPVKVGASQETDLSLYDMENPKQTSITANGFQLLLFIPINVNNRQARAYKAIEKLAGDGLISDVKIMESWKYAFVGTIYATTVEAKIYPKK